jgi:hypothetical protein
MNTEEFAALISDFDIQNSLNNEQFKKVVQQYQLYIYYLYTLFSNEEKKKAVDRSSQI